MAKSTSQAVKTKPVKPSTPARAARAKKPIGEYTQAELDKLWRKYRRTNASAIRNMLVERYLPLVKYNSERMWAKLPDEVQLDDLMSAGIFGLMDAIAAFDLSRGVKFETYCAPRIRGSILDELRNMDWVPRLVRSRAHKVARARREMEARLGRVPADDEVADFLEMSIQEYNKLVRDAHAVSLIPLSRTRYESDSSREVREIDVITDATAAPPDTAVQESDLKELITKGLSRSERLIMLLYYYEEMTMKEIGATLDLSESRVSQMHSAILERMRQQLKGRWPEFTRD
ncbi:MAG: FliA/WhiG family RNA polymerase sigma factor [Phycisphaerae bacterium]|nr:FliA/WhiG family RNA polymerase sigma factor [Phycisphaerae bacterium]